MIVPSNSWIYKKFQRIKEFIYCSHSSVYFKKMVRYHCPYSWLKHTPRISHYKCSPQGMIHNGAHVNSAGSVMRFSLTEWDTSRSALYFSSPWSCCSRKMYFEPISTVLLDSKKDLQFFIIKQAIFRFSVVLMICTWRILLLCSIIAVLYVGQKTQ